VKINIPRVLLELRSRVISDRRVGAGFLLRIAVRVWRFTMENKRIYNLASQLSYFAQMPWIRHGRLTSLPFPFSRWTKKRDFPAVAKTSFRKQWKNIKDLEG